MPTRVDRLQLLAGIRAECTASLVRNVGRRSGEKSVDLRWRGDAFHRGGLTEENGGVTWKYEQNASHFIDLYDRPSVAVGPVVN
jgi:hypothetical protein